MYARLCKLLSERAPNFEGPKSTCNTYQKLLLTQCEEEFRNRAKATEKSTYRKHGPLTPEEEEMRQLAKRKMLGNIKFIGELGKLEMVKEQILHMCIETLLRKKKPSPINEGNKGRRGHDGSDSQVEVMSAEDLECLCQIMRTCGRLLDTEAAKGYFDQYFERMAQLANNQALPSRIRFLLQDIIELRRNKWIPRNVATERGPRTIQEIRQEALRNNGVIMTGDRRGLGPVGRGVLGPVSGSIFGNMSGMMNRGQLKSGMDDVFGSLPLGTLDLGTGPGVINTDFNFNNGFGSGGRSKSNMFGGNGGSGGGYQGNRDRDRDGGNFGNFQKGRGQGYNSGQQSFGGSGGPMGQMNGSYGAGSGTKQLPPRFQRKLAQQGSPDSGLDGTGGGSSGGDSGEEFSLRPPADSIMLKPKTPGFMPKFGAPNRPGATASPPPAPASSGNQGGSGGDSPLPPAPAPPNQMPAVSLKPSSIEIKPVVKPGKKDKGLSKSAVLSKLAALLDDLDDLDAAVVAYKELNAPEKFGGDVAAAIFDRIMASEGEKSENAEKFLVKMGEGEVLNSNHLQDGLKITALDWESKALGVDKLASALCRLVVADMLPLTPLLDVLEGGVAWPTCIGVLTRLRDAQGEDWLRTAHENSKIPLMNLLPPDMKSKEQLATVLDESNLTFLMPLLQVQRQLTAALEQEPSATALYKYIKESLNESYHAEPAFIFALVSVVVKHVVQEVGRGVAAAGGNGGADSADNESNVKAREKDLLAKFTPVLKAFLHDQARLQVTAVYAVQSVCHAHDFPKGMLLKWFMMFYDLEIVDEDAFIRWKEDINDEHPGKGKALFQVNQWLTWLQEAESEEGEDDDDEDTNN